MFLFLVITVKQCGLLVCSRIVERLRSYVWSHISSSLVVAGACRGYFLGDPGEGSLNKEPAYLRLKRPLDESIFRCYNRMPEADYF